MSLSPPAAAGRGATPQRPPAGWGRFTSILTLTDRGAQLGRRLVQVLNVCILRVVMTHFRAMLISTVTFIATLSCAVPPDTQASPSDLAPDVEPARFLEAIRGGESIRVLRKGLPITLPQDQ